MRKKNYSEPIKVKNPFIEFIPEIELTYETENCDYIFSGIYDGSHTLPTKILNIMSNDEILKKGLTKQMMSVKMYTYNPVLTDCFKEREVLNYE